MPNHAHTLTPNTWTDLQHTFARIYSKPKIMWSIFKQNFLKSVIFIHHKIHFSFDFFQSTKHVYNILCCSMRRRQLNRKRDSNALATTLAFLFRFSVSPSLNCMAICVRRYMWVSLKHSSNSMLVADVGSWKQANQCSVPFFDINQTNAYDYLLSIKFSAVGRVAFSYK